MRHVERGELRSCEKRNTQWNGLRLIEFIKKIKQNIQKHGCKFPSVREFVLYYQEKKEGKRLFVPYMPVLMLSNFSFK